MRYGHAKFSVRCDHENMICGEFESTIGRANTLKSAKSIIRNWRKNSGPLVNPNNFIVTDVETGEQVYFEN